MGLTLGDIESLAPDQAALTAARGLLKPAVWASLGQGDGALWGEAQGSGANPYRVTIDLSDRATNCTCPSRKFPCKHALALMWLSVQESGRLAHGTPTEWAAAWLARRRGGEGPKRPAAAPRAPKGASASLATVEAAKDASAPTGEDLAKRAADAAKRRARREAQIDDAAGQLEGWVAGHLSQGLATLMPRLADEARTIARRLADAQAGGLAARVDQLAADVLGLAEFRRPAALAEGLGLLVLLARGWRARAGLPDEVRADLSQAVGFTLTREALLDDPATRRVRGDWGVLLTRTVVQADALQRVETWLLRADDPAAPEAASDDPRLALLLDHHPVSGGPVRSPYRQGERVGATLAFYPSAAPLRAVAAERHAPAPDAPWPRPAPDLTAALADWRSAVRRLPWVWAAPLHAADARLATAADGGLYLVAADGTGPALPLDPTDWDVARPLLGIDLQVATGLWDGRHAWLCTAETEIGRWWRAAA